MKRNFDITKPKVAFSVQKGRGWALEVVIEPQKCDLRFTQVDLQKRKIIQSGETSKGII